MMKLTIGGKQVALPINSKISIERVSPLMNDDSGSYSFPFPVPTLPNQQNLGWPGNLNRVGDIADQSFILEEGGIQILRGEVDYDDITAKEIGIILQSGHTEFKMKMEGRKLNEIDYGSEWWPASNLYTPVTPSLADKLAEWDLANTTDNGRYAAAPFLISIDGVLKTVNYQDWSGAGDTTIHLENTPAGAAGQNAIGFLCLQFKISFVIGKIFESAGFTVTRNDLKDSEFCNAVFLGKVMHLVHYGAAKLNMEFDLLYYAKLMPEIEILTFLKSVKDMFCLVYIIDEMRKEVQIKFVKTVFFPENLDALELKELTGWTHKVVRAQKGFWLTYGNQDNELDTRSNYPEWINQVYSLPTPSTEGEIVRVPRLDRDYITILNDNNDLEWQEIGRLKAYPELPGENVVEIDVKVPAQKQYVNHSIVLECPYLPNLTLQDYTKMYYERDFTSDVPLTITLYHGRRTFAGLVNYPYASAAKVSIDGLIDTGLSLKPAYLYNSLYSEFLNWQTFRARGFNKYVELSLVQLCALEWGRRYMISGVQVIFSKISYDLPYDGKVMVEGFTA